MDRKDVAGIGFPGEYGAVLQTSADKVLSQPYSGATNTQQCTRSPSAWSTGAAGLTTTRRWPGLLLHCVVRTEPRGYRAYAGSSSQRLHKLRDREYATESVGRRDTSVREEPDMVAEIPSLEIPRIGCLTATGLGSEQAGERLCCGVGDQAWRPGRGRRGDSAEQGQRHGPIGLTWVRLL